MNKKLLNYKLELENSFCQLFNCIKNKKYKRRSSIVIEGFRDGLKDI